MNHHRTRRRVTLRAALAALVVFASGLSAAPAAATAAPQTADRTFTVLAAYRGDVSETKYSWWTPVRNYQTNRAWIASLQPGASARSEELKVPGLFVSPARRPATLQKDRLYRISGVMTVPQTCSKPVERKACRSAVVMSIKSITPVTGACIQDEHWYTYAYVCGTATELVGITSNPEWHGTIRAIHVEGRQLRVRVRGTYPQPVGGRIDTSLATGFITLPPHPSGACTVGVLIYYFEDGAKYSPKMHTRDLSFPC